MQSAPKPNTPCGKLLIVILVPALLATLTGCPETNSTFRGAPGSGRPTPASEGAPSVVAVTPASATYVYQGQTVAISWIDSDPDDNATIIVFYDEDGIADSGDEIILTVTTEDADGVGDQFNWNTTGVPAGVYWIGVTIDDGVNPAVTDYALGFVSISVQQTLQLDLSQIGTAFAGTVWRGWNSGDQAGYAMDGGMDVDGDGIDDMVILARHGNPFLLNSGFYGEGYLVFGQQGTFLAAEELNSVSAAPPKGIRGTIFAAPWPTLPLGVTDNGSEGLTTVAMMPNIETASEDPLAGAEIVFGMPFIEGVEDDVDYDPVDSADINDEDVLGIRFQFTTPARPSRGGIQVNRTLPVEGCGGWYLDFDEIWIYHHTYTYVDVWTEQQTVIDPVTGQPTQVTIYRRANINIAVLLDLPFIITSAGDPFVQLNLPPYDGTQTQGDASMQDPDPAQAYPIALSPNAQSGDAGSSDLEAPLAPNTGAVILVSSQGYQGTLENLVISLQEVGQDGLWAFPVLARWAYGARFRPPYTYTLQDEVDNWNGWEDPLTWPALPGDLIPSDWGQSISYADVDGNGQPELLVGAPRMAHRSTWNPFPPTLPLPAEPASGDFGPPARDLPLRSNRLETGGVVVIYSRLEQAFVESYDLTWYNGSRTAPLARSTAVNPYPSWPNCIADNTYGFPNRTYQASAIGPVFNVDYTSRFWLYPYLDYIMGDLSKGGPRQIDPNPNHQNRRIDGGQLGKVVTGLGAVDPLTGFVMSDFDADGLDDIGIGAPNADPSGRTDAGIAYVVYGRRPFGAYDVSLIEDPNPQQHLPGVALEGTSAGDRCGAAVARVAYYKNNRSRVVDFDGDGIADWLVGAPGRDALGRTDAGIAVVVFGHHSVRRVDGLYNLDELNTDVSGPPPCAGCPTEPDGVVDDWDLRGAIFVGEQPGDELGAYVAGVGDVDGDGYAEILISAPGADGVNGADSGKAYLIYGGPNMVGTFDLRDLGTENLPGKVYHGPEPDGRVGPVGRAGDIDFDGFDDYLLGNPLATQPPNKIEAGECYLIYGTPRNVP